MILIRDMVTKSYLYKILVAGEGGVGKTTLLYRYIKEEFLKDTEMTIGLDFFSKNIKVDGLDITLQFWDFGGQDRFQFLHDYYAKGASGAILMFDLRRMSTLENLDFWVDICRKENSDLPILFVGAKSDLVDEMVISEEYIKNLVEKYNFCDYMKVSSKTGENVNEVFNILIKL